MKSSTVVVAVAVIMALPMTAAFTALLRPALERCFRPWRNTKSCYRMTSSTSSVPTDAKENYNALCAKLKKISYLEGVMGLLGWDEQVMMASGSETARGQQKAALAGIIHEAKTDPVAARMNLSLALLALPLSFLF